MIVDSRDPVAVINALMDELQDVAPGIVQEFETSPSMALRGAEWEEYCNSEAGHDLIEELLDALEENDPAGRVIYIDDSYYGWSG